MFPAGFSHQPLVDYYMNYYIELPSDVEPAAELQVGAL